MRLKRSKSKVKQTATAAEAETKIEYNIKITTKTSKTRQTPFVKRLDNVNKMFKMPLNQAII